MCQKESQCAVETKMTSPQNEVKNSSIVNFVNCKPLRWELLREQLLKEQLVKLTEFTKDWRQL